MFKIALTDNLKKPKSANIQLFVPKILTHYILDNTHSVLGHPAYFTTLKTLKLNYFWRSMAKDTLSFTKACSKCMEFSPYRTAEPIRYINENQCFHTLSADICGPLSTSVGGEKYILTGICEF